MTAPFWPVGVATDLGPLPPTLTAALRRSAQRRPDHPALIYYGLSLSYGELWARVERLAAYLQHRCGIRRGDRVLLDMQNSPHFVTAYHAVLRADAVVVPVNPMNLTDELAYLIADSGARVAVVGADLLDRLLALPAAPLDRIIVAAYGDELADPPVFHPPPVVVEGRLPQPLPPRCIAWAEALGETAPPHPAQATADDLCVMPYTSGTTGKPKACMHPHASAVFTAASQADWYGYGDDGVITGFMPLFHVAGMQVSMNGGIYAGMTIVLMTRWDRDLIPPLFRAYGVTVWSAAPTMIVDVLSSPHFDDSCFARLRILTGGGSAMPAAVAAQLWQRFGLRFVEGYGLTETIAATHINPPDRPKPQCLGIPVHATDARVIDPESLTELGDDAIGEIIIAGPQIMRGYWRRPETDAEVFIDRDGKRFLRTGDLGRRDTEGYFFVVDRLKRMINVSGYKVWPAECEATLYHHPAVQECCVVAVADPYRGESVRAVVVRRPGATLTEDELIAWSHGVMAAYKAPRSVRFVDALPRSGSNKIDWRRVQDAQKEGP